MQTIRRLVACLLIAVLGGCATMGQPVIDNLTQSVITDAVGLAIKSL